MPHKGELKCTEMESLMSDVPANCFEIEAPSDWLLLINLNLQETLMSMIRLDILDPTRGVVRRPAASALPGRLHPRPSEIRTFGNGAQKSVLRNPLYRCFQCLLNLERLQTYFNTYLLPFFLLHSSLCELQVLTILFNYSHSDSTRVWIMSVLGNFLKTSSI